MRKNRFVPIIIMGWYAMGIGMVWWSRSSNDERRLRYAKRQKAWSERLGMPVPKNYEFWLRVSKILFAAFGWLIIASATVLTIWFVTVGVHQPQS